MERIGMNLKKKQEKVGHHSCFLTLLVHACIVVCNVEKSWEWPGDVVREGIRQS